MAESPAPETFPPKRNRRRLIALSILFVLLVAVYLPLRANRANDLLARSLMGHDAEGVRDALNGGADPDLSLRPVAVQSRPGTLLDFVRLLLHRSLRPPANNAKTALMYAASNDDLESVSALLQHNANVNLRLDNGYSALVFAASKMKPDVAAALLARGADIHVHTQERDTPLIFAAMTGRTQTVRLLLAKGEDVHEANRRAQTALLLAAENRHEETIQLLLAQGADERDLHAPVSASNIPTLRLIGTGPGHTTITINGTATIVQGGQAIQVPPQPPSPLPIPPLTYAAKYGSPSLLKFLWQRADPGIRQRAGFGVLCDAVKSGQAQSVRFLLDQEVPVNPPRDMPHPNPNLHYRNGYDPGKVYTPLLSAAAMPTPEISALLIARGANVNAEDMFGTTPLLAAAVGGHVETMRLLIEHGANVRAVERTYGQNALMRGVYNVEVARLLLDHGLDVNARDRSGRTALMQCSSLPVATLLIARGADVNARDPKGYTALETAIQTYQVPYVALLLKHGANVNTIDSQGQTPLSLANRARSAPIAALLTAAGAKR